MDLADYLYKQKITKTDFAKMIDHSRSFINLVINKKRIPSKKLAKIIEKVTNGQVSMSDLRPNEDVLND